MYLIEGLYFYELIMLVLGTLLFIVLLIILVVYAVKGKSLTALLPFFAFPIIMVGFPAYQKISYDNGKFILEKRINEVLRNPSDSAAVVKLKETYVNLEQRPASNPETLLNLGRASAILGDTLKALKYIDDAIKTKPNSYEAEKLKQEYTAPKTKIDKLLRDLNENPGDLSRKRELKKELSQLNDTSKLNAAALESAAEAHLMLGDTSQALKFTNYALKKNPNLLRANELKKRIIR